MSTDSSRYGLTAIVLHWILFALVIVVGVLGLLHDDWPKRSQAFWINIHALVGLALWIVLLWKFWLRQKQPPPPLPSDFTVTMRRLARAVHRLLYLLLFITPVIGVITFIWHGRDLDLGFLQLHFGVAKNRAIFKPTEDFHGYLAYGIFALAGVHILAALWHHFVKHDGVLRRMWPKA